MSPQPSAPADPAQLAASRQLEGVVVADHSTFGPGPYATVLLRSLGARVIKFEPPGGEPGRSVPSLWEAFNAGKESIVCDLRTAEGRAFARDAALAADVFMTSWRPGTAERFGLGSAELLAAKPSLVYCAMTGYGLATPLADRPGHDLNFLAASGAYARIYRDSLEVPRLPVGDMGAGMAAAFRITAAVFGARATGIGGIVEVSIAGLLAECARLGIMADESIVGEGDLTPAYGVFRLADGSRVALGVVHEKHFWSATCRALGLDAWAEFDAAQMASHAGEIRRGLTEALARLDRAALQAAFGASRDIPWSLVEEGEASGLKPLMPPIGEPAPELGKHKAG